MNVFSNTDKLKFGRWDMIPRAAVTVLDSLRCLSVSRPMIPISLRLLLIMKAGMQKNWKLPLKSSKCTTREDYIVDW